MTKPKTGVFRGAWLDGTVPVRQLRERIEAEPGHIEADAVLAAVSEAREGWKLDKLRRDTEPEPAQWAELVGSIEIPDSADFRAENTLKRQIDRLPLRVLAELDLYACRKAGIGWRKADVTLLREALTAVTEALPRVRGKRGPKYDPGPALRAVTSAILEHSNLRPVPARIFAADLLRLCGIRVPESRSQLAKLVRE